MGTSYDKERKKEILEREKAGKKQGLKRYSKKERKSLEEIHRDGDYVLIYDEWCRNGGNKGDAVRSVYPDASTSKCTQIWKKVEESEHVRKLAINRVNKRNSRSYLSVEERKAYLTDVIMGDREPDAETKDRLKAIQILNNMEGIGTPTVLAQQNNISMTQNISVEDKRNIINERLNEILGIPNLQEEERETTEENE